MKTQLEIPSFEDLASPDFDEFRNRVSEFFSGVDPIETLLSIERLDIEQAESHPNGFYIIRLSSPARKPDGQARIHIWQKDQKFDRTTDGEIHKHPWHLGSMVLFGTYVEQIAEVTPVDNSEDANYTSIRMQRDTQRRRNVYLDHQLVHVELSNPEEYEAGSTHYVPEPAYHYTPMSSDLLVVTMPIIGRALNDEKRFLESAGLKTQPVENIHHKATQEDIDDMWQQLQEAQEAVR